MMDIYDFTSILFPFNWVLWFKHNFGPAVLDKARKKGMGILALKALAKRALKNDEEKRWEKCWYVPSDNFKEASPGLYFTLSLPVTSAISPSHAELLWLSCDIADNFKPVTESEISTLKEKSKDIHTIHEALIKS